MWLDKMGKFGKHLERQRESLIKNCKHCVKNRFAGSPQTVHCLEAALQTCPKDNYSLWIEATELNIVKEPDFIEESEMSI